MLEDFQIMFQCQEAKGTRFYRKYVVNLIYQAEDQTTGTYSNSRDENIKVKFMYEKYIELGPNRV